MLTRSVSPVRTDDGIEPRPSTWEVARAGPEWAALIAWIVAALGFAMFAIWYQRRQRGAVGEAADPLRPAEQHFPVPIVGLHGLLAVTTLALVFLTAIGVGGS